MGSVVSGLLLSKISRKNGGVMAISKLKRAAVYDKYEGHCAYCGREITIKQMQVDHRVPKFSFEMRDDIDMPDHITNLEPSCAHCNHYKGGFEIEEFRRLLMQLHKALSKVHKNRVAQGFGIVTLIPWDGVFYFEKQGVKWGE